MLKLKILVIFVVTLISIYYIIGFPRSRSELQRNLRNNIRLGADLRGGSQLTLQIHLQDAFNAEAQETAARLRASGLGGTVAVEEAASVSEANRVAIRITGGSPEAPGNIPGWAVRQVGPSEYRLSMDPGEVLRLRQEVVRQTLRVIEKKTNELGLTEATEQTVGAPEDAEILVEMPGVDDPARIKRLLGTAAVLEWLDVKEGPFPSCDAALDSRGGVLPLNTQLVDGVGCYLLSKNPVIRGADIRNAQAGESPAGGWVTTFMLSQDAAKRFEAYTAANINSRAAIVLDHKIISVAVIQSKIRDTGQITNQRSQQDAAELALNLRAGSLPASVEYAGERTVLASLGADSIRQGMRAGVTGLAAVVTVMCTYYRGAGVNATLALALNALILVAALSYLGAVLTLPGIAGVILTIGMAVDSNVLIFERIREELRAGKGAVAAVDAGFSKALSSIVDTHVTTVVACGCLFLFGTGPVKGFAVTLVLGLVANVFTSVFVSRWLFEWKLGRSKAPGLSI
ncbi:MAG: protein translocase subunit SecD [Bryobacteraceae bacterium]